MTNCCVKLEVGALILCQIEGRGRKKRVCAVLKEGRGLNTVLGGCRGSLCCVREVKRLKCCVKG